MQLGDKGDEFCFNSNFWFGMDSKIRMTNFFQYIEEQTDCTLFQSVGIRIFMMMNDRTKIIAALPIKKNVVEFICKGS